MSIESERYNVYGAELLCRGMVARVVNTDHLREFIELSRQLNFTAAAKTLHITQPALSTHIQRMEQEVAAQLVERSANSPVRLTPAGQRFLDAASQMVEVYEEALSDIRCLKHNVSGTFSVRSPRYEYSIPLLEYVHEFRTLYPNVNVELLPWFEADAFDDVSSGAVDFALGSSPALGESGLRCVPYALSEVILWVDRDSRFAHMRSVSLGELDGCTLAIPANHKRASWLSLIAATFVGSNAEVHLRERYSDSLEDFLQTRVRPDDIVVNLASLFAAPLCMLRGERVAVRLTPPVRVSRRVTCLPVGRNVAADEFVGFLEEKYRLACRECGIEPLAPSVDG